MAHLKKTVKEKLVKENDTGAIKKHFSFILVPFELCSRMLC